MYALVTCSNSLSSLRTRRVSMVSCWGSVKSGVLVALVGLSLFEKGCLVVCVLCEKGVQGVVFEAVHA